MRIKAKVVIGAALLAVVSVLLVSSMIGWLSISSGRNALED